MGGRPSRLAGEPHADRGRLPAPLLGGERSRDRLAVGVRGGPQLGRAVGLHQRVGGGDARLRLPAAARPGPRARRRHRTADRGGPHAGRGRSRRRNGRHAVTSAPTLTPQSVSELSVRELRRGLWRRWGLRLSVLVGWAVVIAVWYVLARFVFTTQQLPQPHIVATEAWDVLSQRNFASNLQASILRVAAGFLLALALSIGLGLVIAYSQWWRRLLNSVLLFIVSVPTVSFAILSLIVLGISPLGPVLNAMIVATPYITMNLARGLTGVDRRLIVMSEAFGRTRAQIIRGILLPSSLLSILGGARLAFAVAWRMELLTEVFASADGIGFQIRRSFESYDIRGMLAWAVLFVAIMLIVENLFFRQIERRFSRWRSPSMGDAP
ncbi:MAG: ABC transporter permease subunit [Acidimicrobiia bacterium]|nr:ABC transporter permease subunit [Acidimicrobiia bacterium]